MPYLLKAYDDALKVILEDGEWRTNARTGLRTKAVFGMQCRYRLDHGFPLLTRRKVWPKSIFAELLWFISGSTNVKDLEALGSKIWNPWRSEEFEKKHRYVEGALGPVYGFNLRHFGGWYGDGNREIQPRHQYGEGGFDQLAYMMERLKTDPTDRRIMFSLWNPAALDKMRLPPCHFTYQVMVDDAGRLTGILTQRSCDFPIGVPANIQFYSALTMMLAQQAGFTAYEFVHNTNDSHIYENQIDAVRAYLDTPVIDSPSLLLNKAPDVYSYRMEDFQLQDFRSGPKIDIPVAV